MSSDLNCCGNFGSLGERKEREGSKMSLFDSEETERLKRHQRLVDYQHEQEIAGLSRKLARQKRDVAERLDAESSDMMDKIEALEKDIAELKRQIEELKVKP